jgi:hypothetical protein
MWKILSQRETDTSTFTLTALLINTMLRRQTAFMPLIWFFLQTIWYTHILIADSVLFVRSYSQQAPTLWADTEYLLIISKIHTWEGSNVILNQLIGILPCFQSFPTYNTQSTVIIQMILKKYYKHNICIGYKNKSKFLV